MRDSAIGIVRSVLLMALVGALAGCRSTSDVPDVGDGGSDPAQLVCMLDEAFGEAGFGEHNLATSNAHVVDVLGTPTGEVLALLGAGDGAFSLRRFTPAGTADLSFGVAGVTRTDFAGGYFEDPTNIRMVAFPDGSVAVIGLGLKTSSGSSVRHGVRAIRVLPTGAIDDTFGLAGPWSAVLQNAMHISDVVITGHGGDARMFVLLDDQTLLAFSHSGDSIATFGSNGSTTARDLGVESIAAIFAGHPERLYLLAYSDSHGYVVQALHLSGAVDEAFGANGVAPLDIRGMLGRSETLSGLPDGSIVATVPTSWATSRAFRVGADGILLDEFGNGGSADLNLQITDAVMLATDAIVFVGHRPGEVGETERLGVLVKLLPSGGLDVTFGDTGERVLSGLPGPWTELWSVSTGRDEQLFVGGRTGSRPFRDSVYGYSPAIIQLERSGSWAADFGPGGLLLPRPPTNDSLISATVHTGEHIFVFGNFTTRAADEGAVARSDRSGQFDSGYGIDGTAVSTELRMGTVLSGAVDSSEFAWVGLSDQSVIDDAGYARTTVARFTPGGHLDTHFGTDGHVDMGFWNEGLGAPWPTKILPVDDGALLLRPSLNGETESIRLAKLDRSGRLASSFGGTGYVVHELEEGPAAGVALVTDSNGRIVVAGSVYYEPVWMVTRFTPDGLPDLSFGEGGRALFENHVTARGIPGFIIAVLPEGDGRLMVIGIDRFNDALTFARLLEDGSLDTEFGVEGLATVRTPLTTDLSLPRSVYAAFSAALTTSGGIQAALFADDGFIVVEVTASGQVDSTSGESGIIEVDIGDPSCPECDAAVLWSDVLLDGRGNVYLSGTFSSFDGTNDVRLTRCVLP